MKLLSLCSKISNHDLHDKFIDELMDVYDYTQSKSSIQYELKEHNNKVLCDNCIHPDYCEACRFVGTAGAVN